MRVVGWDGPELTIWLPGAKVHRDLFFQGPQLGAEYHNILDYAIQVGFSGIQWACRENVQSVVVVVVVCFVHKEKNFKNACGVIGTCDGAF